MIKTVMKSMGIVVCRRPSSGLNQLFIAKRNCFLFCFLASLGAVGF